MLNCLYAIDSLHNPDAAVALASAVNDWQIAEWFDKERITLRVGDKRVLRKERER